MSISDAWLGKREEQVRETRILLTLISWVSERQEEITEEMESQFSSESYNAREVKVLEGKKKMCDEVLRKIEELKERFQKK